MTAGLGSVDRILELARRHLGLDVAWMSAYDSGHQRFEAVSSDRPDPRPTVGEDLPLAGSFCVRVLDGRLTPLVSNTWADPVTRDLAAKDLLQIGAYAGTPIRRRDGSVRGMLCCTSVEPRPTLDPRDLTVLELLADVLAEITEDANSRAEELALRTRRIEDAIRGKGRRTVFQAMIEIERRQVVGLEALSRFPGDTGSPAQWFAQAGEVDLGAEFELAAACSALALIRDVDDVMLAVNISPGPRRPGCWTTSSSTWTSDG